MAELPHQFFVRWLIPAYLAGMVLTALYWCWYGAETWISIVRLLLWSTPGPLLAITTATLVDSDQDPYLTAACFIAAYGILVMLFWWLRRFLVSRLLLCLIVASWSFIGALLVTVSILSTSL